MKLDNDQENAARYINGHSIIIASAGSGKTTTLLGKINYLIDSGIKENEILVLSYTNETVNSFKKKCQHNVSVFTFHKAAMKFLLSDIDIADEYLLDDVISSFLLSISDKFKKKIYYSFKPRYKPYSIKNYKLFLEENTSNSITNIIKSCVLIIKTNNINIKELRANIFSKTEKILLYCTNIILNKYNKILKENRLFDFDDLIIKATEILNKEKIASSFKHILVDEYQDISNIRLNFLEAMINKNNATLTVVGDDWQSIYRFSGSNIKLFTDFNKYFKESKTFILRTTYRCPQQIIDSSSKFIMRNKMQIRKKVVSHKKCTYNCIKKIYTGKPKQILYKILKKIKQSESFFILSRNNFDIKNYKSKELYFNNDKVILNNKELKNGRFLTFHSSKGLEADIVVIINLVGNNNGFPSLKNNNLIDKIINIKEPIKYAEERRLFYVAMTRAKKMVYLIIDKVHPSKFIKELK